MIGRYGIILLDHMEVIVRIYQVDAKEWKLLHYQSKDFSKDKPGKPLEADDMIRVIAEVCFSHQGHNIIDWKIYARRVPLSILKETSLAVGMSIENLTLLREQELLCKGMFTELW